MKNTARRKRQGLRGSLPSLKVLKPSSLSKTAPDVWLQVTRAPSSESDSDSDYGAPSKKKKRKPRMSDEIRISTRGGKVPNYFDDVDDFEEDTHPGYYYADPATQVQQEDEIELVLTHSRDEGREDDPDDNFFDNIVSFYSLFFSEKSSSVFWCSVSISSGRTSLIYTTPTKPTSS